MKILNTFYLVAFFVSGALAVPMTDDVIDAGKRDASANSIGLPEAAQPGAGDVPNIRSVLGRNADGESEVAEASELEARHGKKNRTARKCGKKGKKCLRRGKKHRKGKKKNKKAKKVKKANKANAY